MPRKFAGVNLTWNEGIQDQVIPKARAYEITEAELKQLDLFRCAKCKKLNTYAGMHLGHNVEWATWFERQGITKYSSRDEILQAYNDPNNLVAECATCNQGHEWEDKNFENEEGADAYSDEDVDEDENLMGVYDKDGKRDDFVVPDTACAYCNAETDVAEDHLICHNKACQAYGWSQCPEDDGWYQLRVDDDDTVCTHCETVVFASMST